MRCLFFLALLLLVTASTGLSQEIKNDTLTIRKADPADTSFISGDKEIVDIKSDSKRFDPRKAMLYSAIFPGAGQFYNRKYWKMPLVYGGFGALFYITNFYHELYIDYREEYFIMVNNPDLTLSPSLLTKDQLRSGLNKARRERDFFIIMNGLWYIFQMVDAHVDAHLKEFEINPKMQVRLEPMMENSMMTGRNTGFALKISF